VDAQQALDDLTEISSQIRAAVVFDDKRKVAGSTAPDGDAFARAAADLLAAADEAATGASSLAQLEVATAEGSVFVVRQGKVTIAATTGPDPTVGLVFYDLKSALRNMEPAKPKPAARKRPATTTPKKPPAARKPQAKKPKPTPRKKKPDAS
jgi:predicted regulator of Ras-like GTPase activity (Roadblock/LC7/MglB family)